MTKELQHEFRLALMTIRHVLTMCSMPLDTTPVTVTLEVPHNTFNDLYSFMVQGMEPWRLDQDWHKEMLITYEAFEIEGVKIKRRSR